MNVPLIFWEVPSTQNSEERFPYFALLLYENSNNEGFYTVLYFTHQKQMVFTSISMAETHFTEISHVEVPYEVYQSILRYVGDGITIKSFCDKFLSCVDRFRRPIDEIEDELRKMTLGAGDQVLAQLSSKSVNQPFPRKLKE
jgi:hypothetical protein